MLGESLTSRRGTVVSPPANGEGPVAPPPKPGKSSRPGPLVSTLWAVLAFFGVQLAVGLAIGGFIDFEDNLDLFMVQGVAQLLTVLVLAKVLNRYQLSLADLGLRGRKFGHLGAVALGFGIYIASSALFTGVIGSYFGIDLEQEQDVGFAAPSGIELLLVFLALVVITPVVEELLFRGFLYRAYRRRFGAVAGAILVSILFALVHGQWNVGLDVFVLSLVLCYLREKTDSLWPPILLHGVKNGLAFLILFVFNVT